MNIPSPPIAIQSSRRLCRLALGVGFSCVVLSGPSVHAAIDITNNPELAFTLWDPIQKASYTLDLGIKSNDFFNYAQSDSGYQHFWTFGSTAVNDPSVTNVIADPAFAQLLQAGTPTTQLRWLVEGADSEGSGDPGDFHIFTTLRQGTQQGVPNPWYDLLSQTINSNLRAATVGIQELVTDMCCSGAANPYNFQTASLENNGSGFYTAGQKGYLDPAKGYNDIFSSMFDASVNPGATEGKSMNGVGQSSWFYKLTFDASGTYDSEIGIGPEGLDEFDNGTLANPEAGNDGYWGFIQDPANPSRFVLSYTLASARLSALATTPLGRARSSQTEFLAGSTGDLISTPTPEFAGYVARSMVTPIPEPSTLAMWLGGLGLLLVARSRRKAAQSLA